MNPQAEWEPHYHQVFVDLCVEQKLLGNTPEVGHMLQLFRQRTGVRFGKKQLRVHWDAMIKQWKIWQRLVQCSDMKWDPETNTFGASDQDWANYLQVNPDAGQYRLSPPLFLKKLEMIFEGINTDDEGSSGSKRKQRSKNSEEENDVQSASNSRIPRLKVKWSPSSHELFIDLLVQEASKGHRSDTRYPKESWKMIHERINEHSGKNYTRAQIRNHWDITRKDWKIWCQVVGASIMKWDPNTRTFGATDEDWKIYIKENPRAIRFKRKHVAHADKLAFIFQGIIEPGNAVFRTYRRRVLADNHSESQQLLDPTPLSTLYKNEPVTGSEDGDDADDDADDDDDDDDEPSPHRRRFNGVGFAESSLQDVEIGMEKVKEPLSVKNSSGKQLEYSITDCIECLDAMKEVEEGSDLYMFALDLFLKKAYREMFLQLKKPSLKVSWLLRLRSAAASSSSPTIAA